jgi:cyclic pyranopterin phosphate synthase
MLALDRARDRTHDRFRTFNERGGKFRVAVTDICNLDCFFCHNEAMPNPRRPRAEDSQAERAASRRRAKSGGPALPDHPRDPPRAVRLETNDLVRLIDAFAALGGAQVNITGGEPLARPDIVELLSGIDKRGTRVVLNTNALLADRLLSVPRIDTVDAIFASLHTSEETLFHKALGARHGGAGKVMDNLVRLTRHGYAVQINYSLGAYNARSFGGVVDFAIANGIDLKAIALVRPTEEASFYGGDWIDPRFIVREIETRGGRITGTHEGLGGRSTFFEAGGTTIKVKNIAEGRLETEMCTGCAHREACGEGVYALRVGVDGYFKPCLLAREQMIPVRREEAFEPQILAAIDHMIGDFGNATFRTGAPS